jgi:hypothetical protein
MKKLAIATLAILLTSFSLLPSHAQEEEQASVRKPKMLLSLKRAEKEGGGIRGTLEFDIKPHITLVQLYIEWRIVGDGRLRRLTLDSFQEEAGMREVVFDADDADLASFHQITIRSLLPDRAFFVELWLDDSSPSDPPSYLGAHGCPDPDFTLRFRGLKDKNGNGRFGRLEQSQSRPCSGMVRFIREKGDGDGLVYPQ